MKVIQRFIELGEGFADIYELIELTRANQHRLSHLIAFHTEIKGRQVTSIALVLTPSGDGKFQPIYISREGIPHPEHQPSQRYALFQNVADELGKTIIQMDVKPSILFPEIDLYYQHLIAILRLNHYIAPLQ
ncbi:hypothetical protein JOC86_003263 [Bacillus pakistanensis]|uniref:DUF7147 domain-containing protein n=1 Tax=Rossellomorea pakistanensis TaxID=992288 RepID=A0ABS2NFS0_9BACI|nr:hypothetical protein [Bacillus pakistanensis]